MSMDNTSAAHAASSGKCVSADNIAKQIRTTMGLANEDEMAAILQISSETLATWRTKKKGPPSFKLGKRVFYLLSEFSDWINAERRVQNEQHGIRRIMTPVDYKPVPGSTGDPAWMR